MKCQFASDNTAGICPEAWESMRTANEGFALSYGNDEYTAQASDLFREIFETNCDVFFVFNGTAANSLALASLCQSYHSVITHELSHIETDECGAPEFFSNGTKLLLVSGKNGKLDTQGVEKTITKRSDIHYPKPKAVSITNSTEIGTVYNLDEIRAIHQIAHKYNLKMHLDGSRFANAVASLKISPAEATWKSGIDVLCFGGTKLGMGVSEAVIFFDPQLSEEFAYRCKQSGQLASKMRYLAAPWIPLLKNNLWIRYASHANQCAALLARELSKFPKIKILYPVEANVVFAEMPEKFHCALKEKGWVYYTFIGGGARFMCSWQTTEKDVHDLLRDLPTAG